MNVHELADAAAEKYINSDRLDDLFSAVIEGARGLLRFALVIAKSAYRAGYEDCAHDCDASIAASIAQQAKAAA